MPQVTVDVEIVGTNSLVQSRFHEDAEVEGGKDVRKIKLSYGTPREQAEKACYRDPKDGALYHPGAAIGRALREAGGSHKQRGSRRSLKYIVPAGVLVLDDTLPLFEEGKKRIKDFEVDSRPVVIPATKGRVMRHRPRHDTWLTRFRLRINTGVLDEETVHMLLVQAGEQIGIGDYRPEKGGPFGTFRVTSWKKTA